MMKTGKVVLIAGIVILTSVLSGCVGSVNPETGEKEWEFAPVEAAKNAVTAVKEIPDETKASIFEALAWVLGSIGVGAAAAPTCSKVAEFYRNRGKNKAVAQTQTQSKAEDKNSA